MNAEAPKHRDFFVQTISRCLGAFVFCSPAALLYHYLLFKQVGAQAGGAFLRLLEPPVFDVALVAGKEDGGNVPAFVGGGTGIDGRGEEVVLERIREGALFVADCAGEEADDGVGYHGGCQFAAGQDVVAYGYFFCHQMLADAVINAFVVAAEEDETVEQRHCVGHALVERFAVGRGVDDFVVGAFRF